VVSGISFNNGKHLRFQYRLAGADNKWISVPAAQYLLEFPLLQPGQFTLQLRAISANGIKGPIRKYTFTILKPWWQTGWFIGGILIIAALGIYLFISSRIVSIRLKNALLLEKLSLQSQWRESTLTAIRSQMNPHFIFNALNTIQSYIYANDENKASNYLGKFSDLIRRILDYSQKEQITLTREIEMLQLYMDLEVIRFENTMKANIYVDENLNTDNISLPPMLVQPYIENALKHGLLHKMENRELFVRFETDSAENHLLVTIDDNGIGRVASEEINQQKRKNYASFATVANQKRLDILNLTLEKKITIETIDKKDKYQRPIGTLVILKIPLLTQS
jgi:LytS/YehU family sensor histidine kinase